MYSVDRQKIENTLIFMEQRLQLFQETNQWESDLEKAALERIIHTIIDGILDVGNAMIDGFIMRDPGSYEDIIDILEDEKVVTSEMATQLKIIVAERKMIVQQYIEVTHERLASLFRTSLDVLEQYPVKVREYLRNELGPVSAFQSE